MPLLQVIVLAVVQGLTEFLPISSTARTYTSLREHWDRIRMGRRLANVTSFPPLWAVKTPLAFLLLYGLDHRYPDLQPWYECLKSVERAGSQLL